MPMLITRRSQVQILPPPPTQCRKPRSLTWASVVVEVFHRVRLKVCAPMSLGGFYTDFLHSETHVRWWERHTVAFGTRRSRRTTT